MVRNIMLLAALLAINVSAQNVGSFYEKNATLNSELSYIPLFRTVEYGG